MAKTPLGQPPKEWSIPVTRGCDRLFTVRRRNSQGAAINWDALVWIDIDIDRATPTRAQADVTDSDAIFVLQSTLCDQVRNTTRWRIVMSVEGIETALAVGTFERHDG